MLQFLHLKGTPFWCLLQSGDEGTVLHCVPSGCPQVHTALVFLFSNLSSMNSLTLECLSIKFSHVCEHADACACAHAHRNQRRAFGVFLLLLSIILREDLSLKWNLISLTGLASSLPGSASFHLLML